MGDQVLITRPRDEAKIIADLLIEKGYKVICEPFLSVHLHTVALDDLRAYQGLVFTSANGVRAFCHNSKDRTLPVMTVGNNTAEAARENGFSTIENAQGDAQDLARLLQRSPADKPYLHIRGQDVSRSLVGTIEGASVVEKILYHTDKIDKISERTYQILADGGFSHVLFFSKRTAESFVEYLIDPSRTLSLGDALKRTKALCLGSSMVECLSVLSWKDVVVAPRPDREGMLTLLE